ncbi:hydrophobin-251 [Phellopilus nigrolimitatus]|nr:hydrophobin-251 [Phellopilus nigrolimitatus]
MFFQKLAAVASLAILAVATPTPQTTSSCNTGSLECCNSVQSASSPQAASLLGLLGVVLGADVPVGLTCSPLSVVGLSSSSCTADPVCCSGNNYSGLVVVGCSPINL